MLESESINNQPIADRLREMAELLEAQGANPFRAGAYRKASAAVARLPGNVRDLFDRQGAPGLETIPGVGEAIARRSLLKV